MSRCFPIKSSSMARISSMAPRSTALAASAEGGDQESVRDVRPWWRAPAVDNDKINLTGYVYEDGKVEQAGERESKFSLLFPGACCFKRFSSFILE